MHDTREIHSSPSDQLPPEQEQEHCWHTRHQSPHLTRSFPFMSRPTNVSEVRVPVTKRRDSESGGLTDAYYNITTSLEQVHV